MRKEQVKARTLILASMLAPEFISSRTQFTLLYREARINGVVPPCKVRFVVESFKKGPVSRHSTRDKVETYF